MAMITVLPPMNNRRHFLRKTAAGLVALNAPHLLAHPSHKIVSRRIAKPLLPSKLEEAIYAFVVADAMGGSVENLLPEQIKAKFGNWDFNTFLPPTDKKDIETGLGKGNGRTTDDTLNLETLIGCYVRHQDHLDAYDYAEGFVKGVTENKLWIAEKGKEMTPNDRPL